MGFRMYAMINSEGDITFQVLHHGCIRSHAKTYPDKALEKERAAWPSRGQGPDEAVRKGTTWTSRTRRTQVLQLGTRRTPGQKEGHRVRQRGRRTTP